MISAFKGEVPQLRAALQIGGASQRRRGEAKMSVEFVRLDLCRCHATQPRPKHERVTCML